MAKRKKRRKKIKRKIKKQKAKRKVIKTKISKSKELIFKVSKKWSKIAYVNKNQYEKKYKI